MDLDATLAELAPKLLRYCLGVTVDRSAAEEAAQEALTALVQRWRRFGPPQSPPAFVFAVARRRARRARLKQLLLEPLDKLRNGHQPTSDPEARAVERQRLRHTAGALARLPHGHRQALLLVAAGELDVATAAGVLGISRSALKMRVHRARQRLQELLEDRHAEN